MFYVLLAKQLAGLCVYWKVLICVVLTSDWEGLNLGWFFFLSSLFLGICLKKKFSDCIMSSLTTENIHGVYYVKIFFLFLVAQVLQFFKTDCFLNWDMVFLTEIWLQEGELIKPEFCVERQVPIWVFLCLSEVVGVWSK